MRLTNKKNEVIYCNIFEVMYLWIIIWYLKIYNTFVNCLKTLYRCSFTYIAFTECNKLCINKTVWTLGNLVSISYTVWTYIYNYIDEVEWSNLVVMMPACHAGDRGSIARSGRNMLLWKLIDPTLASSVCTLASFISPLL